MKTLGPDALVPRRDVLAGIGGLCFCLLSDRFGVRILSEAHAKDMAPLVTQWIRIGQDDKITVLSAGAEMGQGSMGGLAYILAEEMDADWSKVTVEFAPAEKEVYGYQSASNACLLQSSIAELGKCPPE